MAANYLIVSVGILTAAAILVGTILIIRKIKPSGWLKTFVILTGASLAGFLVFAILHNVVSALLSQVLKKEIEEPVFFLLATIACPIGALVGIVGSIVEVIKRQTRKKKAD